MRLTFLFAVLAATFALPATAKDEALAKAIAGSHRSPQFVARDKSRHPQEALEFFGLKPDMTVVEISPGGGYWTEILAPYLRDKGTYYTAIAPRAASERAAEAANNWQRKLADSEALYGKASHDAFVASLEQAMTALAAEEKVPAWE